MFKYYNYRADWSQLSITNLTNFISIVECDYRVYTYSVQQKREKGRVLWGSWENISGTHQDISDTSTPSDASKINTITNKTKLFNDQSDLVTIGQQNTKLITSENSTNGYQIRCLKE